MLDNSIDKFSACINLPPEFTIKPQPAQENTFFQNQVIKSIKKIFNTILLQIKILRLHFDIHCLNQNMPRQLKICQDDADDISNIDLLNTSL